MPTNRNKFPDTGAVIAVPMLDGTTAIGQLAGVIPLNKSGSVLRIAVAFFPCKIDKGPVTLSAAEQSVDFTSPMMVIAPTDDMIRYGAWQTLGHRTFRPYRNFDVARHLDPFGLDGASSTGFLVQSELECYWGVLPWDHFADPRHIDKLLLPGYTVPPYPPHARWRKDFSDEELVRLRDKQLSRNRRLVRSWPRRGSKTNKVIHIQYALDGTGLPTVEELLLRHELEAAIDGSGFGAVVDAGGGEGRMDIYVETKDVAGSFPIIRRLVEAAGLEEATVEVDG